MGRTRERRPDRSAAARRGAAEEARPRVNWGLVGAILFCAACWAGVALLAAHVRLRWTD